jgi:hypothetical protein
MYNRKAAFNPSESLASAYLTNEKSGTALPLEKRPALNLGNSRQLKDRSYDERHSSIKI